MQIPFVDLVKQYRSLKREIDRAIQDVICDAAFIGGKYVEQFEDSFARYCCAQYCVGVGNGTDAIYIALRALGIGPGDEVITVANSFIATSEAITMTGAKVVFVDCDEHTYNIDVTKITDAITSRTRAIVPVHLFGQPAAMWEIKKVAAEYGLFIVEDAAQAHGAEIDGQRVGTFGDAACFSFFPGKNLGAYGDAGAIVTNNESLAVKCRMIANHGRIKKYDHEFEGINSRLDGLQASILHVKLAYLDSWIESRRRHAKLYRELLANADLVVPEESLSVKHVYHLFVIRVQNREAVQRLLKDNGISTGVHYPIPLPRLQAYRHLCYDPGAFPLATKYSEEILSLPIYPELRNEEIEYVCDHLLQAVRSCKG